MYLMPGNHDIPSNFAQCLFDGTVETDRLHCSFRYGGIHFVCPDWGTEVDGAAPDTPPDLVEYVTEIIDPEEPTILLLHYTPWHTDRWLEMSVPKNIDRFWTALAGKNNILGIFAAHLHQTFEEKVGPYTVYGIASTCYQQLVVPEHYRNMLEGLRLVRVLLPLDYRVVRVIEGKINTQVCRVNLPLGHKHQAFSKPHAK